MSITEAQVTALADRLMGTCDGLDETLAYVLNVEEADFTLLPTWALERLDEMALKCEGCEWWHEPGALDEEGLCDQCREEVSGPGG